MPHRTNPNPNSNSDSLTISHVPTYETDELAQILARSESINVDRLAATIVILSRNLGQLIDWANQMTKIQEEVAAATKDQQPSTTPKQRNEAEVKS